LTSRYGIFTTLTSTGSRELVGRVLRACATGEVRGAEPAFVFVNREPGESPTTDASAELLAREHGVPMVRASARRFRPAVRAAASRAAQLGDEAPLWGWRDAWWASNRHLLEPTDLDLCLGDMWIWGAAQCAERKGVNLHPALPTGPLGKMWFDVLWDMIEADAHEAGVMLHLVTTEVDRGPVVAWCRYSLRTAQLEPLWEALPSDPSERSALIAGERALARASDHDLFTALRARGLAREIPLVLAVLQAVADGDLRLVPGGATDPRGRRLPDGLDLTGVVESRVAAAAEGADGDR